MKNTTRFLAAGFLLGLAGTAAAHASSSEQSFADRFREMQALSSTSPYAFKTAPAIGQGPVRFRSAAEGVGKKSFAERFAQMQAISSNSGEFRLPGMEPGGAGLRVAAAPPVDAAGVVGAKRAPE